VPLHLGRGMSAGFYAGIDIGLKAGYAHLGNFSPFSLYGEAGTSEGSANIYALGAGMRF